MESGREEPQITANTCSKSLTKDKSSPGRHQLQRTLRTAPTSPRWRSRRELLPRTLVTLVALWGMCRSLALWKGVTVLILLPSITKTANPSENRTTPAYNSRRGLPAEFTRAVTPESEPVTWGVCADHPCYHSVFSPASEMADAVSILRGSSYHPTGSCRPASSLTLHTHLLTLVLSLYPWGYSSRESDERSEERLAWNTWTISNPWWWNLLVKIWMDNKQFAFIIPALLT